MSRINSPKDGIKWCSTYSLPVNYPSRLRFTKDELSASERIPPGYQPVQHNPGGLKFYMYDYPPFFTRDGQPMQWNGLGWKIYEKTGKFY
jgi:hypothetical protein